MDKPSPYFSNLKCRECGRLYPKQAIHVCDFDFGPLEALIQKTVPNFKVGPKTREWWSNMSKRESFKKVYPNLH